MRAPKKLLSREFKRFRRRYWLSQSQLAEAMGVSRYFISDVERCRYEVVRPNNIRKFYVVKERYEAERRNSKTVAGLHLS